jgi:cell division protease FtsH
MNRQIKTIVFWLFIGISAVLLWSFVRATPQPRSDEISYSHFLWEVEAGSVESVSIAGQHIHGKYRDGRGAFQLVGPGNPGIYLDELRNKHVEVRFQETQDSPLALTLLGTWAPLIMLGILWWFMIRQMQRMRRSQSAETPKADGNLGSPSAASS